MELGFFLALDLAVGGQAEGGDGFASLGVMEFGITGGVADENDFVDAAHASIIAMHCKHCVRIGAPIAGYRLII